MGTWDWDFINGVVSGSAETEILNGLAPGTFEGTPAAFERLIHPDDWPPLLAEMRLAMVQHRESTSTYRAVWPEGSEHWLDTKGRGMYAADGSVLRMTGTSMDVTAHKHAEADLLEGKERIRAALHAANMKLEISPDAPRYLLTDSSAGSRLATEPVGADASLELTQLHRALPARSHSRVSLRRF